MIGYEIHLVILLQNNFTYSFDTSQIKSHIFVNDIFIGITISDVHGL